MALNVLWVTGISKRKRQDVWFRPLLHINQLWRWLYIFGLWFPQLKNYLFSSPIAFWLQPALSCWRHTAKDNRLYVGKAGNTEPSPEQGVVIFKKVIFSGPPLATGASGPENPSGWALISLPPWCSLVSPILPSSPQIPGHHLSLFESLLTYVIS